MAIVADSSPLISLVRIGRLGLLQKLYRRVLVPPSVHREVVVEGRRLRKAGAQEVEQANASGWIRLTGLTAAQLNNVETYLAGGGIGRGEAEALALARGRRLTVIVDDKNARALAQALDLEYMGTAAVLLEAFWGGLLGRKDFVRSLEELSKVLWLSPDVVTGLLRLAEEGP